MLIPNLSPPENIRHQSEYVEAYMNQKPLGIGSLYIAESQVSWTKENSTDGLCLRYPNIAIHAISRDLTTFQFPCLYLMLDINIDDSDEQEDDSDDDEDKTEMTEIRFVPRDPALLDFMYKTLNDCQLLNPDAEDDFFGEEDEGSYEIRGGIPAGEYEELYEENMEDGLEDYEDVENNVNGHNHDGNSDDDDVEMGQFDDVDQ